MGTALASGYTGPPALTPARALTEWTLDPWMLALIVILGAGYLAGIRRVRARGGRRDGQSPREGKWPVARPIWF